VLFVKHFSNAIFLLRLAAHVAPAMDKLYYSVQNIDQCLEESKAILDDMEETISKERASTIKARMRKYYLHKSGSEINAACDEIEK
jgi:hypothetical protein